MSWRSREKKMRARTRSLLGRPCHYCGQPATTRDHVVPKSKGGTDARMNIVPSCRPCNERKANAWPTCDCARCAYARTWKGGAAIL